MKTCPRCGSKTFDDMDVCYGCLYRFAPDEADHISSDESTLFDSMPYPLPEELAALPEGTVVTECSQTREEASEHPEAGATTSTSKRIGQRFGVDIEQALAALADFDDSSVDLSELPTQMPQEYCLCLDEGGRITRYRMGEGQRLVVGRSHACDVEIADPTVSRRHVAVSVHGGALTLEDLGSSNPTYIDGQPLAGKAVVALGALVSVAQARLWAEQATVAGAREVFAQKVAVSGVKSPPAKTVP